MAASQRSSVPVDSHVIKSPSTLPETNKSSAANGDDLRLRYKLAAPTFRTLCDIQNVPDRRIVLKTACLATEFRSFPIKQSEKSLLREINDHTAIPYPLNEPVSQPWHKVFLVVQIDLIRAGWPNKISASGRQELLKESSRIYMLLDCVVRCLVDILGQREDGRGVTVALDVLRSIKAKVWEGSEMELLQIDGIGAAKMRRLVDAGIKTIKQLAHLEFYHIERLLSRNPPFGHQLLHQLSGFPLLHLDITVISQHAQQADLAHPHSSDSMLNMKNPGRTEAHNLWLVRIVLGYLNNSLPTWCQRNPWTTLAIEGDDGRLVWFWRGSVKRLSNKKIMAVGLKAARGEVLKATLACEGVVGTIIRTNFTI